MKASTLPRIGVTAIVAAAVFGSGATAAWMFLNPSAPPSLAKSTAASSAPVAYQSFSDARTVSLSVTRIPAVKVSSGLAGRVTSTACTPGGEISSGSSVLSINEQPVIALATSVPLWRDLVRGDQGPDVKSVQTELARLGYPVAADGSVGTATLNAAAKLFKQTGDGDATIPASRVLWIPASAVRAESCAVGMGATVAAGDPVFTVAGGLEKIAVAQLPNNLVGGDRTLTVGSTSVPVGADGAIVDDATLSQLEPALPQTSSPGTAAESGNSDTSTADAGEITGEFALAQPIRIGVVPPTAVYGITGSTGCVSQNGEAVKVTIVGSQLGETYIHLPSGKTPKTVDLSDAERQSCT